MLTLLPSVRVYLAAGVTDMRRSIDGLSAIVRERLQLEPLSGHLFLFRNRRGGRITIVSDELDEISELRRLSAELAEPELRSYTIS